MTLNPQADTAIRDLAEYLKEGLNNDEAVKQWTVVKGLSVVHSYAFKEMPLLAVYRTRSYGKLLDRSQLNIVYFIGAIADYSQVEGALNWVSKKIASLLIDYEYQSECLKFIDLENMTCDFQLLLENTRGMVLPHIRISTEVEDRHLI